MARVLHFRCVAATAAGFLLLTGAASCDADPGPPLLLQKVSGDAQLGLPERTLAEPLRVRVLDAEGTAVPGVSIQWTAPVGSGTVDPTESQTGSDGVAEATWTLGPASDGPQTVIVEAVETGQTVFTAHTGSRFAWERVADLPVPVRSPAVAADGERLYVFGGSTVGNARTDVTQVFDPATNTWSLAARMPRAVDFGHAVYLNGRFHVFGGVVAGVGTIADHWTYDPAADTWSFKGLMALGVDAAMAGVQDGQIVVVGGVAGVGQHSRVSQSYDPATGIWVQQALIPGLGRLSSAFTSVDGALHILGGGIPGISTTAEHLSFDATADTWMTHASLPDPVEAAGAGTLGGYVCYFGGRLARSGRFNTPRDTTRCASQPFAIWEEAPAMTTPRAEVMGGVLGGSVYAVGGHDELDQPVALVERLSLTPLADLAPTPH